MSEKCKINRMQSRKLYDWLESFEASSVQLEKRAAAAKASKDLGFEVSEWVLGDHWSGKTNGLYPGRPWPTPKGVAAKQRHAKDACIDAVKAEFETLVQRVGYLEGCLLEAQQKAEDAQSAATATERRLREQARQFARQQTALREAKEKIDKLRGHVLDRLETAEELLVILRKQASNNGELAGGGPDLGGGEVKPNPHPQNTQGLGLGPG